MFSQQHIINLIGNDRFSIQELLKKVEIEDPCQVLLFCNFVAEMINDKKLIKEGNIIMNSDKLQSIPASPETEWLSAREMALKYGVTETTVYQWCKTGKVGKTEGKRNCYYYVKKPKEIEFGLKIYNKIRNKEIKQIEKSETKECFKITIFVENSKIVSEILSKLKENEKMTIEKCQL